MGQINEILILLRSNTGLNKRDQNSEVAVLPKLTSILFAIGNYVGPSKGDLNGEMTLLLR